MVAGHEITHTNDAFAKFNALKVYLSLSQKHFTEKRFVK